MRQTHSNIKKLLKAFCYILPGLVGYGCVQIFLTILTLSKLSGTFPDTPNMSPGSQLCYYDQNYQVSGGILGVLALISNVAFTGKMLFNLYHRHNRSRHNISAIIVQFFTLGMIGAMMNADNALEAAKYFTWKCNQHSMLHSSLGIKSFAVITIIFSFCASSLSKSIALTDEIQIELAAACLLLNRLGCYRFSPQTLRRSRNQLVLFYTPRNQLALPNQPLSEIDPQKIVGYMTGLGISILLTWTLYCKSYQAYSADFMKKLLETTNNLNISKLTPSNIDFVATVIGHVSWSYNSLVNTLLWSHHLLTPRAPDFLTNIQSNKKLFFIALLSLCNSVPQACLPLLQPDLNPWYKTLIAFTMVLGTFVFAVIGLDDLIQSWYNPHYTTRATLERRALTASENDTEEEEPLTRNFI